MITHVGTCTIETERLILRKFEYTDDEAMLKYWVADEKIQKTDLCTVSYFRNIRLQAAGLHAS